jgi:rubrerythrin
MLEFNADEIFEIAEKLERNAASFYRRAAGMTQGADSAKLLLELASMEDEHQRIFAELRAKLASDELRRQMVYETQQYLWAWADCSVFPVDFEPGVMLKGDETLEAILTMAIGREKDTIVFFEGLKRSLKSDADRNRVDAIIVEELGHLALLSQHRAAQRQAASGGVQ